MTQKFNILYVDDEIYNLNAFQLAFRNQFGIVTSNSAAEALVILEKTNFEIIISDQRMPEINGVDFFEKVTKNGLDSIKILLTGFSDIKVIEDAINKGRIFYYATKPWKKDEMNLILIKSIDHYNLVRQNKNLVKKLSAAVKELEVFLYRASHDLRSPITTQLGLINLLKLDAANSAIEYISKLEESIKILENTLLKISQLSQKSDIFVEENLSSNLKSIVQNVLTIDNPLSANVEVNLLIDEADNFYFEKTSIETIVRSIIENAFQYRRVEVDCAIKISNYFSDDGKSMTIAIEDNGIGISELELPKIFNPFYRATTLSKGSGLGLYVAKKICESMGGVIEVSSKEMSWTKFFITIPNSLNNN